MNFLKAQEALLASYLMDFRFHFILDKYISLRYIS
jgi:hypothetical protein